MATKITFPDGFELTISATLKKRHGRKATLTKHKVESGGSVADHRIKENYTFSLDGIMDDSALFSDEITLMKDLAWERIEQAYDNDELLEVETSLKTYTNMTIADYSAPEEANQGKSLFLSLEFEELRYGETKTVKVGNVPKSAIAKTNPKLTQDKKVKETHKIRQKTGKKESKGKKNGFVYTTKIGTPI